MQAWFAAFTGHTGHGYLPRGLYVIDDWLSNRHIARDVRLTAEPGAVVKAVSDLAIPLIDFIAETPGKIHVEIEGGFYDQSQGRYISGKQSSTCINVTGAKKLVCSDAQFVGSETDYRSKNADSGLTIAEVQHSTVRGARFFGFSDAGIYVSGGRSPDPEDDQDGCLVTGCHFELNALGVTSKRGLRAMQVIGNSFAHNGVDVAENFARGLPTGRASIISSNYSRGCVSRFAQLRASAGSQVTSNVIEDFGFDLQGNSVSAARGIILQGVKDAVVQANTVRLRETERHMTHTGIQIANFTHNGVVYVSENNLISNNRISNMYYGIREHGAVGPNFGSGNLISETVHPIEISAGGSKISAF